MPNKISEAHIDELMSRLTFHYNRVGDTSTTHCTAFLDGFSLVIGVSASVDWNNYNQVDGEKYAKADALTKARLLLWEFEGYRLKFKDLSFNTHC